MPSKKLILIISIFIILIPLITMACDTPADCSPGFWKNHTELWYEDFGTDAAGMLAGLQGGKDTRISRFEVADILNAEYPWAPCDD